MKIRTKFIIPALLWLCAGAAGATNIVSNPGFEQGNVGWDYEHFALVNNPMWAHTGPGMARLTYCSAADCLNTLNRGAFFGQVLPTTAGEYYDLSFWVRSFTGESRFSVFWDGALLTETGTANGPMLQYRFTGLVASANATLLQMHGYNNLNQHMSFDDFFVVDAGATTTPAPGTPAQVVPEPAAYALLLAGLGALVFITRRRPA